MVRARTLGLVAALGVVVVSALVIGGLKTGRLDPLVVTEAGKSLQYRGEYWVGAWRVITENPSAFWFGRGPGNFGWAYLQHKLPEASEEIRDPHNMVLDVWATAGVWAALALVSALGLGLYNALGPASKRLPPAKPAESVSQAELDGPPERALWLVGWGGAGLVVVVLLGRLNLFDFELQVRWVILGFGWVMAAVLGQALWRRLPISAAALGAAALAVSVNLIAAGGIGFSAVAMPLWALVALGLNLRDDRPCHRPRVVDGRLGAFALAGIWAALVGSFAGAIGPFWTMEADLALADAALRARPPVFDPTLPIKERARRADAYYARARIAYDRATRADKYSARAWLGLAYLEGRIWKECGQEVKDERWKRIPILLFKAVDPPRNPNSWVLHRQRANVTRDLLAEVGPSLAPNELLRYRANIIEATRKASQLYPSNAGLHARLAEASAEIGMFGDAVLEANKALELDRAMPHLDKKLEGPLRARIQEHLPAWEKAANGG